METPILVVEELKAKFYYINSQMRQNFCHDTVQSLRAMTTCEVEIAVGTTTEEMTESTLDIHGRRAEKGKEVERGEASRAAQPS